jgi:hypothetical protein
MTLEERIESRATLVQSAEANIAVSPVVSAKEKAHSHLLAQSHKKGRWLSPEKRYYIEHRPGKAARLTS